MNILGKKIGKGEPVYIVAELSANHNHNIQIAKDTIYMAKEAGADAIKIQSYEPDTITIDSDKEYFKLNDKSIWDGMNLYKLYQSAYTPFDWHKELFDYAKSIDITIFSTPFDLTAVDLLQNLNTPAYKIASFEINDIPLIKKVAGTGKPIIISTGIAKLSDIEEAIETCRNENNNKIILLKCTSAYPASPEEANLKTINNMAETFNVDVGLSDHTMGNAVSIAAVALGACMIERHVILDKSIKTPDCSFSLDKNEFKSLIKDIRTVEKAIGKVTYSLSERQLASRKNSRSLFVVENMKTGDIITEKNVKSIRPGYGIHTRYYSQIIGKKVNCNLEKGTPMEWKYIK